MGSLNEGPVPEKYEKLLQKLESDVRTHIRVEQQLKLHIESMQAQLDEAQSLNQSDPDEIEKMKEEMEVKENHVKKLEQQLLDKERSLKEKTQHTKVLEEKLKSLESKHKQELERLRSELEQYKQQKSQEEKIRQLQIDLNQIPGTGFGRVSGMEPKSNSSFIGGAAGNTYALAGDTSSMSTGRKVNPMLTHLGGMNPLLSETFRSNQNRTSLDNYGAKYAAYQHKDSMKTPVQQQ